MKVQVSSVSLSLLVFKEPCVFVMLQVLLDVEMKQLENEQKSTFLTKLNNLDVDNTRYLVAKQPHFRAENEIVVAPSKKINV